MAYRAIVAWIIRAFQPRSGGTEPAASPKPTAGGGRAGAEPCASVLARAVQQEGQHVVQEVALAVLDIALIGGARGDEAIELLHRSQVERLDLAEGTRP